MGQFGCGKGESIDSFTGQHDFLSNFYECEICYDSSVYRSTEAAFQAQKTVHASERMAFTNLTPRQAKGRGKKVALRSDWEYVKDNEMLKLLRLKFAQPELREKLRSTGERELIEGNHWGDRVWGAVRDKSGQFHGENRLGKLLMKVRGEIRYGDD